MNIQALTLTNVPPVAAEAAGEPAVEPISQNSGAQPQGVYMSSILHSINIA